jgi:carbon-monoxide dehydrogenase medium subunit
VRSFEYVAATSLEQACSTLAAAPEETKVLAGGAAMVLLMRNRLLMPSVVIDIKPIDGLDGIVEADGILEIGALTRHAEVERSALVRQRALALAELEARVGSPQIRNLGTLGGNLCHAEPAGDPPTLLCALGARVRLFSQAGTREVPLDEFILGYYETALQPDEILTHVLVPTDSPGRGSAYVRFCSRSVGDMPLLGVAAVLTVCDGVCEAARVVLGNVGTRPVRASKSEDVLTGNAISPSLLREAATAATEGLSPLNDVRGSAAYRLAVLPAMVEEALTAALGRASANPAPC